VQHKSTLPPTSPKAVVVKKRQYKTILEGWNLYLFLMKKVESQRRPKQRYKQGRHPNCLANLKDHQPMYEERKVPVSVGLTPKTREKLKKIAERNSLSVSELIERIGRVLSPAEIENLLTLKA
jgi:DNA replication protein DnaD